MFEYEFMQRAFVVGSILAVILPCIGLPILLKRLSMMGDTLSHASLAGVAIGLCFGFDPLLGSVVACIIAGLSTEILSARLKSYQEISTVIVLAASIGLAGIFT
ncbi:MAG: metal ABC transporter permease, partial [Atopobium minutum]|nr:metal ABC transporter permease [Atopobium minutum]